MPTGGMASCASPIRARRITCRAWQQPCAAVERSVCVAHRPLARSLSASVHWLLAHSACLLLVVLVLASGINLPLIVAAATASATSATSTPAATSTSSAAPAAALQPHVLLISLPWRGHVFPLRALGARLVERGFHVSFGIGGGSTNDAKEWLAGSGIELLANTAPTNECATAGKRTRERQPLFPSMSDGFNVSSAAKTHPGAQLTDLFSAPPFAFQSLEANGTSSSGPPNGVALLMRTYTDFQACMHKSLATAVGELMQPRYYDQRWKDAVEKQKKERAKYREKAAASASSSYATAASKKERERELAQREAAFFPPVLKISPPKLVIIDRFTFAGMDVAKSLNLSYIVNNPHVLLDLGSPSWSLPAPWSYLPPVPPLALTSRVSNLFHRLNYRATMMRAFEQVNTNRRRSGLVALESWGDYFDSPLVLTNTIWGVELHRSADSQGMHSHRNVNVQANGYTPRFKMTGPLLPVADAPLNASSSNMSPASLTAPPVAGLERTLLPAFANVWEKKLLRFLARAATKGRRLVYVNLGDGYDLTRRDVAAVLAGLEAHAAHVHVIWSLPKRRAQVLLGDTTSLPTSFLHILFVPQFQFLATFAPRLDLVVTHATLANVQEALAASLPVLLLPHPYVDQLEVAARFARTNAVYVLQRVQLTEENVRRGVERIRSDPSYATGARHLSPLFLPSSSSGTSDTCALVELVYRLGGWSHLMPYTANPFAQEYPLPWSRDGLYGLPIDILALYAGVIALIVAACKYLWNAVLVLMWTSGSDKRF